MNMTIKYFGLLAEITQCSEEELSISGTQISDLLQHVVQKYPGLESKEFKIAMNHQIVDSDTPLSEGEVAFLPPFSGG